jgi:hypothetical protein
MFRHLDFFYEDITFGKSWDSGLLIVGPGSSATYWLWKFDANLWIWNTLSPINSQNSPDMRSSGKLVALGSKIIILHSGYALESPEMRYQDLWGYFLPDNAWELLSGPSFASNSGNATVQNGINIPEIGNSSNSTVIPGMIKFASFSWKRNFFVFGGNSRSRTSDLVMKYTLCFENEIFDGRECIACSNGKVASNEILKTLESCESICATGSAWNGSECSNCTAGRYSNQLMGSCVLCSVGSFSEADQNSNCQKCTPGKFRETEGPTSCAECQSGSYIPILGSSTCIECFAGFISPKG